MVELVVFADEVAAPLAGPLAVVGLVFVLEAFGQLDAHDDRRVRPWRSAIASQVRRAQMSAAAAMLASG